MNYLRTHEKHMLPPYTQTHSLTHTSAHFYMYTMDYYSAIKKNVFESVLMRWMKLEPIIPSEISRKKNTNTVY